jgi:hypothetical protein
MTPGVLHQSRAGPSAAIQPLKENLQDLSLIEARHGRQPMKLMKQET